MAPAPHGKGARSAITVVLAEATAAAAAEEPMEKVKPPVAALGEAPIPGVAAGQCVARASRCRGGGGVTTPRPRRPARRATAFTDARGTAAEEAAARGEDTSAGH